MYLNGELVDTITDEAEIEEYLATCTPEAKAKRAAEMDAMLDGLKTGRLKFSPSGAVVTATEVTAPLNTPPVGPHPGSKVRKQKKTPKGTTTATYKEGYKAGQDWIAKGYPSNNKVSQKYGEGMNPYFKEPVKSKDWRNGFGAGLKK